MVTNIIITTLIISQIVSFYFIFKKTPFIIKKKADGIVLKDIPEKPTYETVEPNHDVIFDVLETIKLENWNLDFDKDFRIGDYVYELVFTSNDGKTTVRSRFRYDVYDNEIGGYSSFWIAGPNGTISLDKDSPVMNDVILFMWDYVIEHEKNSNQEELNKIKNAIKGIKKSLVALRREEQLKDLLDE